MAESKKHKDLFCNENIFEKFCRQTIARDGQLGLYFIRDVLDGKYNLMSKNAIYVLIYYVCVVLIRKYPIMEEHLPTTSRLVTQKT